MSPETSAEMRSFSGQCHCGNLELRFESRLPAEQLPVRECSCSFCRSHGARSTSDPDGRVRITVRAPGQLSRYRFGMKTADFLVCKRCGVYLTAVMTAGGASCAVINVNALHARQSFTREPVSVTYDGETEAERQARRAAKWTPVVAIVEGDA